MANLTLRSTKGAPLTHDELDGNFEYLTGSVNAINASTGSFLTAAQTGSMNISNTLYTVNTALSASTTSSATTSICSYGVNVFEHVTPTKFATKLPQPTTGKSVRIINNGSTLLSVYPSNVGGKINNYPVNSPAVIPPDGNLYEFICIKNPLPGDWTFSAPATGQYDSGEIEISLTSLSKGGYNPIVVAYNSTHVGIHGQFNSSNWGQNGKNKSNLIVENYGGNYTVAFRPDTAWKGMHKIKVYTNLISDPETTQTRILLNSGGQADQYSLAEGAFISTNLSYTSDHSTLFELGLTNKIAGAAVTGSTQYTSANIGDAGTAWGEKVAYSDQYDSDVRLGASVGTTIGNKSFNTSFPYPYATGDYTDANGDYTEIYRNDPCELFYSSYISFQIQPFEYTFDYDTIPDFKFRFIIEYYQ